ncbi:BTB/POZ domain-containing protein 6-A isoform X2 [Ceratina calcarata]|nr:BTB/POZ domain-containing protein 6-A isoform X2 [Ceratina calcarata]
MFQVPLIAAGDPKEASTSDTVILEVGLLGDTWRYCVQRQRLAERSEWFRAMLVGPLAPARTDPPPVLKLQHVEKRAFDHLLRYLLDEPINFQSVSTARATLDAAHQYLCPDLARLAVEHLEKNLNPGTVLETYMGLSLYANHSNCASRHDAPPSAPPAPGDIAGETAALCTRLLHACLDVVDSEPEAVFAQERFEELDSAEVEELSCRDTLRLTNESALFRALDRWAASECRRNGVSPSATNKRSALSDEVWYSVRYPLMTDKEFIDGPMASGILSSEESALIVSRILGHDWKEVQSCLTALPRLSSTPRFGPNRDDTDEDGGPCGWATKRECRENRKNRRKECVHQGQRTCARIGNCLVKVLACIFD